MRPDVGLSVCISLALGLSACGPAEDDSGFYATTAASSSGESGLDSTESGNVTASGGSSGSATDGTDTNASTSAGDDTGSSSSTGPLLDIGGAEGTAEAGGTEGCRGVDFLFIIDNSGSMEDEQNNLLSSFPGFVQSMQEVLEDSAQSFRVMVTDTDGIGGQCTPICEMFPTGYCNGISCAGDACEVNIGGGNIVNQSTGTPCELNGKRYADSADTSIPAAFNCIGRVGASGSGVELVADSMLTALSPGYVGAGGCNQDFLRDDAVLVVTIITDEDDAGNDPYMTSPGDPTSWYNDLALIKDYDPDAIVVLGLLGDTDEPDGICQPYEEGSGNGAEQATRLRQFVQNFGDKGLLGSVCSPSYNDFFEQATALIDTTCDDFIPPD